MGSTNDDEFLDEESKSLKVHVQSCVRRHKEILTEIKGTKKLLWGLILTLFAGGVITTDKVIPLLREGLTIVAADRAHAAGRTKGAGE